MARVRAQFPHQAQSALIRLAWLERARERALKNPVEDSGARLLAGVDVGGGEAETVVFVCEVTQERRKIINLGVWRAADTRGHVVRFLEPYRARLAQVRVDAIGIGYHFAMHLRDQGFPVELINVSRTCDSRPQLRERNPAQRFVNEKARFYQALADLLERNQLEGLRDNATIEQLAGIVYEIDGQGRMKIESKERARERGAQSPDRAEALMLALGEPPVDYSGIRIVRSADSWRSQGSGRANLRASLDKFRMTLTTICPKHDDGGAAGRSFK
jgi:phage terminase large subunit